MKRVQFILQSPCCAPSTRAVQTGGVSIQATLRQLTLGCGLSPPFSCCRG